jgi:hypothetical protein
MKDSFKHHNEDALGMLVRAVTGWDLARVRRQAFFLFAGNALSFIRPGSFSASGCSWLSKKSASRPVPFHFARIPNPYMDKVAVHPASRFASTWSCTCGAHHRTTEYFGNLWLKINPGDVMILCDLCNKTKKCFERQIEGKEYDICADCWEALESKLKGKGRLTKEQEVVLPPPSSAPAELVEPTPLPEYPPKIWGRA